MRILLDSHVFVWAKCAPENLSDDARATLIDPASDAFVSVASFTFLLKRKMPGVQEVEFPTGVPPQT